jgi:transposase InsO family protein
VFEVANLREDFLLGTEMVPAMYPGNDIIHGSVDMDLITDRPDNIERHVGTSHIPSINRVSSRSSALAAFMKGDVEAQLFDESTLYDGSSDGEGSDDSNEADDMMGAAVRNLVTDRSHLSSTVSVRDDILALSDKIGNFGAGELPIGELPVRPSTSSSPADQLANKKHKDALLRKLQAVHEKNEKLTGFCSHPDSIVTLTVLPENESKLYRPQYKIADALKPAVQEIVDRWRATGKIEQAPRTGFNSPLLAVPKKDDKGKMTGIRLCIDIRTLNQYLVEKDQFQLPRINEMLAAFAGNKLFGEYDLSEAYFQFKLSVESQRYTAFTWDSKQYVFVGCPFGIKHIPSLFQRFITNLFADMPFVFPYIDNIAFASRDWEDHYDHARMIVERLNSVNLRIKPSSYNLGNTQINLLGHQISAQGISLDPEKVEMISKWELPVTGERLQSALGLGAYLRDHIRHYADIAAPLEAVKSQKVIVWDDKLRRHWQLWKRAFASAPILSFPDFAKRMVLATDASQTGIGGIVYQPDDDDNTITPTNIVAITSKQLNGSQRNYPVYKKELWAVVFCLRKFHSFLWGRKNVTVLTDHKPLIHILDQRQMTVALQQWVDVILDYDLVIKYRPGILHVIPDALSRMYERSYMDPSITWGTQSNITFLDGFDDHSSPSDILCKQSLLDIKPLSSVKKRHRTANVECRGGKKHRDATSGKEEDNDSHDDSHDEEERNDEQQQVMRSLTSTQYESLSDDVFIELDEAQDACALFAASDAYTERIARVCMLTSTNSDRYIDEIVEWMETGESSALPSPCIRALSVEQKLLLAQEDRGKKVPSVAQQHDLLTQAHAQGHFGEKAMYQYIQRQGWWWPKMRDDIIKVIDRCNDCRKFTITQHGYHPARSITAAQPGDHYQIDLAQFKQAQDGSNYALVLIDVCSGFIMLRPLKKKTAQAVANELWQIFTVIGIPKILQSDNGTEFLNETMRALTTKLGVPHRFISEYNPRADGKVERVVRTVKQTVMKLLKGATVFWPLHLPFVQYAYNNKVQTLTGATPFSLMYARTPNSPIDYTVDPHTDLPINLSEWKMKQEEVLSLVLPAVGARASIYQAAYRTRLDNMRRKLVKTGLRPGTKVELKDPRYLLAPRPSSEPTYIGPYYVVRQNKYGAYIMKDQHGKILDRTVPIDQMKMHSSLSPPPPIIPDVVADAAVDDNNAVGDDEQQDEYDVEYIYGDKIVEGKIHYHVKWKGYPKSQSTWESEDQFNDRAVIERYWHALEAKKQLRSSKVISRCLRTGTLDLTSVHVL